MRLITEIAELAGLRGPVFLAIGVFDGLHLGHHAVIEKVRELAAVGGTACVVTFDPHPIRTLRPDKAPRLLTSTLHKKEIFASMGVEALLLIHFDKAFAAKSATDFVTELYQAAQPLGGIVVGHEWGFGKNREGNLEMLREFGNRHGFTVHGIAPVEVDGARVSSTRVRQAVEAGELALVEKLLGRPFSILGRVEKGRQIGRTLGVPTANLSAHSEQFPPDGVYAVAAIVDGEFRKGVANIGFRPTVERIPTNRTLEVHFPGYQGDLYEKELEITFRRFLRGEKRFENLEELQKQIALDVQAAAAG